MSTPATTAGGESGVSKLLSRAKTVLRKKDGSKRFSSLEEFRCGTTTPSAAGPRYVSPPFSATFTHITQHNQASEPTPHRTTTVEETPAPSPQKMAHNRLKVMRSQIDAERANRLGERFKLP